MHQHPILNIRISIFTQSDSEALSIVGYIGCGISIACLLFTIAALIALRWDMNSSTLKFKIIACTQETSFQSATPFSSFESLYCITTWTYNFCQWH